MSTGKDIQPGLTMRFEVDVDGTNLGGWATCEGLEVSWTVKPYKEGGENTFVHQLPERLAYKPIQLSRAMTADGSAKVMSFLKQMKDTRKPVSAAITLYDAKQGKVASWELRNAFPTRWSGPSLKADSKDVALEKLELTHEGFL